jgi:outer membrane autotransporter protein
MGNFRRFLAFLSFAAVAFPPAFALGQTINIESDVDYPVFGNGETDTGKRPVFPDEFKDPNGNTVNIMNGVKVTGGNRFVDGAYIYGESNLGSSAADNRVNVLGGFLESDAVGAFINIDSSSATAYGTRNSVRIDIGSTVKGAITGAHAVNAAVDRSTTGPAGAVSNEVVITGSSTGNNTDPTNLGVSGGFAEGSSGTASRNSVSISGSTVSSGDYGGVVGGIFSDVSGSGTGSAGGNRVIISDSAIQVGLGVAGGFFQSKSGADYWVIGNGSGTGSADGNSVIISGGTIEKGNIYGGLVLTQSAGSSNSADNNTVTILNDPVMPGVVLYGGLITDNLVTLNDSSGATYSGNTLNLYSSNLKVKGIKNFRILNFHLPSSFGAGDAMLRINTQGAAAPADIADARINVGMEGSRAPLKPGDSVVLINMENGTLAGDPKSSGTGMQGVTLRYELDIIKSDDRLLAEVRSAGLAEQTKALSEGYISGLSLVNQGADLVAGQGMENAVRAASAASGSGGRGFGAFGTLSGGFLRYNTGSHVNMSSLSLLAGLSLGADLAPGRLTLGAFFEYGNGSYDTRNSFSNAASVHGDGDIYHIGGGILGRMDFIETGPGRFYVEASGRVGGVHNEYGSSDLRDEANRKATYDSSSAYHGFHLGSGYVLNITENASLDLYGKYFWTRQEGDDVTLSTGDPVKFKDADSSRMRFGGRFACMMNDSISPYIGAAWEYEFDGKSRASSNGYDIDAPSLRGDTGIGELGLTVKPSQSLPLSLDVGVQGYTGKREWVTGSLQARLEF